MFPTFFITFLTNFPKRLFYLPKFDVFFFAFPATQRPLLFSLLNVALETKHSNVSQANFLFCLLRQMVCVFFPIRSPVFTLPLLKIYAWNETKKYFVDILESNFLFCFIHAWMALLWLLVCHGTLISSQNDIFPSARGSVHTA